MDKLVMDSDRPECTRPGHRITTVETGWPEWAVFVVGTGMYVCFESEKDGREWYARFKERYARSAA